MRWFTFMAAGVATGAATLGALSATVGQQADRPVIVQRAVGAIEVQRLDGVSLVGDRVQPIAARDQGQFVQLRDGGRIVDITTEEAGGLTVKIKRTFAVEEFDELGETHPELYMYLQAFPKNIRDAEIELSITVTKSHELADEAALAEAFPEYHRLWTAMRMPQRPRGGAPVVRVIGDEGQVEAVVRGDLLIMPAIAGVQVVEAAEVQGEGEQQRGDERQLEMPAVERGQDAPPAGDADQPPVDELRTPVVDRGPDAPPVDDAGLPPVDQLQTPAVDRGQDAPPVDDAGPPPVDQLRAPAVSGQTDQVQQAPQRTPPPDSDRSDSPPRPPIDR